MTSDYGKRTLRNGDSRFHHGIDLVGLNTKYIKSPVNGVVKSSTIILNKSNLTWQWGNYIRIDSVDGYKHYFCHLSKRLVKVGDKIKKGQIIGIEGQTGYSFGSHLHYEIRTALNTCVNPQIYWKLNLKEYVIYYSNVVKKLKNIVYDWTLNGTFELCGNPLDVLVRIVDKNNRSIEEEYCVNGTFFYHYKNGTTFPTSILYANDTIYQNYANHLPCPQSCFIIYKNGLVDMKQLYNLDNLNLKNIHVVIGGVGLVNKLDKNFKYNPSGEGFKGIYSDILRKTNKTFIGYNKKKNKLYLVLRKNIKHHTWFGFNLIKLCLALKYDMAISIDGGGSSFINNDTAMVVKGDGRRINNIIGFFN